MILSSLQFAPRPATTLAALLAALLLAGLGLWQLDRADEMRALAALLAERHAMPAVDLTQSPPPPDALYRTAVARGHLVNDKALLIENRKHAGKVGYHLIVPLKLSGAGAYLVVNRGWIAAPDASSMVGGDVEVVGQISYPSPPALELDFPLESDLLPPRWPYFTLAKFSEWSGLEVYPYLLLEQGPSEEGFVREWPAPRVDPAMHSGYAVQWFAFAGIVLAIWFRLSLAPKEARS